MTMDRATLISWAEGFGGIAVAIFASVGVVHGFDHVIGPGVLMGIVLISMVAACINALTADKSSGADADATATIAPKRAAVMAGGLLMFGFAIWALGLV